jgi:hypothetical protein
MHIVDCDTLLIGAEGGEDSCGSTGLGRPRRSEATRRLPGTPAESEAAWSGNQQTNLTHPK